MIEAGLYVICGALRLARFNVQTRAQGAWFVGLPIPGAAICVAGLFFLCYRLSPVPPRMLSAIAGALMPVLALLMVSRVPYPNSKRIKLRSRMRESLAVALLLAVLLFAIPELTLFAIAAG